MMNKTGETTPTSIIVSIMLFSFVILGGFTIYAGFLGDQGVSYDSELSENISTFYLAAQGLEETVANNTDGLSNFEQDASSNTFWRGVKAIGSVFQAVIILPDAIKIVTKNEGLSFLPNQFWTIIISILSVICLLAIAGAYWRHKL